jgi:4'-phosphopantetheinyl transferase EntD
VIDLIVPDWVEVADTRSDGPPDELFPAERELIAKAVPKRQAEFSAVRACARAALARLGRPPVPILPGLRGAPQWPDGIVGSMTHCAGYRAAVVAESRLATGIGVDAEPHEPLPDGVLGLVALAEEQAELTELSARRPDVHWDRLLFTMKESVYKVWFPITLRWLDFHEARVEMDPASGRFVARLLVPGPELNGRELTAFHGRFLVQDGLAMSAIVLPAGSQSSAGGD